MKFRNENAKESKNGMWGFVPRKYLCTYIHVYSDQDSCKLRPIIDIRAYVYPFSDLSVDTRGRLDKGKAIAED